MKEFLLSSAFLWSVIGLTSIGGIIAVLWRNTVWEARGITPEGDVERLRGGGVAKLLPKSATAWYVIAGVVLAVIILWMLLTTSATPSKSGVWSSSLRSPSVATVVAAVWSHWLWILIIWGILIALIALNTKVLGAATGVLHWVLGVAMLLLFVVLPFIGWVNEPPKRAGGVTRPMLPMAAVPLASTSPSSWPKLVIPAGGRSELVSIPLNMRIVMDGDQFDLHTVYADGRDCSFKESGICPLGAYVGSYAVNKAQGTNVVSYAFAPIN